MKAFVRCEDDWLTKSGEKWQNDDYTVYITRYEDRRKWGAMTKLMIVGRKGDGHRWSDMQAIKNHFCGEENEGVQFFPPQSEVRDFGDGYHVFVFDDPEMRTRIGFGAKK